jgi:hypothetical protein
MRSVHIETTFGEKKVKFSDHSSFMIVTLLVLSTLPVVLADVPPELFSPLIAQKNLATFLALPSPIEYPQYTNTTTGDWVYFDPTTWTSAFFPGSLYLLNTRAKLCGTTASNDLGTADWLDLARIGKHCSSIP